RGLVPCRGHRTTRAAATFLRRRRGIWPESVHSARTRAISASLSYRISGCVSRDRPRRWHVSRWQEPLGRMRSASGSARRRSVIPSERSESRDLHPARALQATRSIGGSLMTVSDERIVAVQTEDTSLEGALVVPADAKGIVLFAHGSGSSRHSPRNIHVAEELQAGGLGTLLLDLLTPSEEAVDLATRELRFDIELLGERLSGAIEWLASQEATRGLPIALFGASTGAAGALVAAARLVDHVGAVVSRGGRPD